MMDMDLVHERHLHDEHVTSSSRPSGVIAVGFLLMLAGFPIFLALAPAGSRLPLLAISVSLLVEVVGIGLVAMADWARSTAILTNFALSILLTIRLVGLFVSRVPRSTMEFATYGPTMAVLGLVVAGVIVILPCFTIMGYLGSREVKRAFWHCHHQDR